MFIQLILCAFLWIRQLLKWVLSQEPSINIIQHEKPHNSQVMDSFTYFITKNENITCYYACQIKCLKSKFLFLRIIQNSNIYHFSKVQNMVKRMILLEALNCINFFPLGRAMLRYPIYFLWQCKWIFESNICVKRFRLSYTINLSFTKSFFKSSFWMISVMEHQSTCYK